MAHGKETPRQKMIGMMYLVLMAMLALNVSKDVLDAFVLIDESLTTTTHNFIAKNSVYYEGFARAAAENPKKAGPWRDKAEEVKAKTDELYDLIQDLKLQLIYRSEGEDTEAVDENKQIHGDLIAGKDNLDIPAEIMIGPNLDGEAFALKSVIEAYREHLLSLSDESAVSYRESIEKNLDTKDIEPKAPGEEGHSWESAHFEHLPLIAVISLMTKTQSDIRNAESDALQYLYSQIDAGSFKFNKLDPVVISNSNHIIRGNEYSASIFMAAFDTTQEPVVYIGSYDSTMQDDGTVDYKMTGSFETMPIRGGKGIYTVKPSTLGEKKWGGIIALKREDGTYTNKPFRSVYTVAEPSLVVSPTKMNVFYQAVDNPVEISVPGFPSSAISASFTNGRIQPKGGSMFNVVPTKLGDSQVSVSVKVDGVSRSMGTKIFRVEKVPDPFPTLAGMRSGSTLAKSEILGEMGVKALMPEWFKFDLEFKVTSFTLSANIQGFTKEVKGTSANFDNEMRETIRNMRAGSRIYFDDVQAVGPDGSTRNLGTLAVKIR